MIKHTPGPWVVREDPRSFRPSIEKEDRTYFIAHVDECMAKEANAQLIAAAPDLLEALEALVKINEEHNLAVEAICGRPLGWKDSYLDAARAAIARSKGEKV